MKLALRLFVREHRTGAFTLEVLGRDDLTVFTEDLARGKEELGLAIADRIERTHPSLQATFASPQEVKLEELRLAEGLIVAGQIGPERGKLDLAMLVSSRRGWTSVWFPKLDLHGWIPKKQDYEKAAKDLAHKHVERLAPAERLALRSERKEWIEPLVIEVEPAKLEAFIKTGTIMLSTEPEEEEAEKTKEDKRPPTPTLQRIGVNLTESELDKAHGRDRELAELERLLAARGHKAIVLIGQSGSGKSALISELVRRRPKEASPVWFADASRLVATGDLLTDWQRQTLDVIEEAHAAEVVWSIGSLIRLLDAGKHIYSEHNVAAVLRPYLAAKRVTVIGECTPAQWATLELRDVSFARCFIPYRVEDPPPSELEAILRAVGAELRVHDPDAIAAAKELAARYLTRKSALGAAVQLLRRAAERTRPLARADVCRQFASETGLPELIVRDDLKLNPSDVREFFEARIVGQSDVVERMVDLIAVIKAGLPDPRRPLGTFLFVGPTGVGKTETAKALAAFLFGSERRLLRFDMSEYVAYDAVSRFLGDARTEGKLVESVRKQPFTVLLLDEIEKAHPAIFDVLLAVLGEARLTDEAGRTADFKNVVVVMTSNLGVESMKPGLGFEQKADTRAHFAKAVAAFFRPEMFNRIDHVVPFRPLPAQAIDGIAHRQLELLKEREGLRRRGLDLVITPELERFVAERGIDDRYGARPLKRAIERNLTMPLARHLSAARVTDAVIEVAVEADALAFEVKKTATSRGPKRELAETYEKLDRLRFRLDRWLECAPYRDVVEEVRLLEKLSASPKFWKDRETAEARTQGLEPKRELLAEVGKYRAEVDALAQLLVESHFRRDESAVEIARETCASLAQRLEPIELRIAGAEIKHPEKVLVILLPEKEAHHAMKRLFHAYAEIADLMGWRLDVHQGVLVEPQTQEEVSKKIKRKEVRPVRWRSIGKREPGEGEVGQFWRDVSAVEATALWITGPHAATWLRHETGTHVFVDATDQASVKVLAKIGEAQIFLDHPSDYARQAANICRMVHEVKQQILDHHSELVVPLEAKLSRGYRRVMKSRVLLGALGESSRAWLRNWETA